MTDALDIKNLKLTPDTAGSGSKTTQTTKTKDLNKKPNILETQNPSQSEILPGSIPNLAAQIDNDEPEHQEDEVEIIAFSQQSRFHRETFDANSIDIDIKGVNITISSSSSVSSSSSGRSGSGSGSGKTRSKAKGKGGLKSKDKDILVDAHLRLKMGVKYGMVGQNGVGKSVLMHVLGNNILVGLPQNVKFLHIAQLEEVLEDGERRSILDEVLYCDGERSRIIKEARALQGIGVSGKDSGGLEDPEMMNSIIHDILLSRAKSQLEKAQKIATKRSGQRGHIARQDLIKAESSFLNLQSKPKPNSKSPYEYITTGMTNEIMNEVFSAYEMIDEEGDVVRAKKILMGLGFKEDEVEKEGKEFKGLGMLSGGWRMRIMLGKALFLAPDVLLLDEPTNHLDLPAILWLQDYLINGPGMQDKTVVIVSHDRNFLDSVTDETIVFKDKQLKYHNGNYDDWERNTEEQRRRKTRLKELEMKKRKDIKNSIQKNVQQAKSTGDDKRLGMVASRKKKLERMGMEKLEDGKRYKKSYHGFHDEIIIEQGFKTIPIQLPPPEPFNFPGASFLQLSEVSFRYSNRSRTPNMKSSIPSPMIINKVSLDIGPHARIGLLGPNGCGKSTIMNLLAGQLKPTLGELKKHHRLRIGYFSQHTVDQLELSLTPLEQLIQAYPDVIITENEARSHFGSCGISGDPVTRPIRTLSGGQRNRVAMGLITFHRPHVLLLDEITNHLDMGTVESLVEALCGFDGALVVVSHDVWFLKQVIEGEDDDEDNDESSDDSREYKGVLYMVTKSGELKEWDKGLDAYVDKVQRMTRKGL